MLQPEDSASPSRAVLATRPKPSSTTNKTMASSTRREGQSSDADASPRATSGYRLSRTSRLHQLEERNDDFTEEIPRSKKRRLYSSLSDESILRTGRRPRSNGASRRIEIPSTPPRDSSEDPAPHSEHNGRSAKGFASEPAVPQPPAQANPPDDNVEVISDDDDLGIVDLAIPEPSGGWGDLSPTDNGLHTTQGLFANPTQAPDLDMPEPDGGWDGFNQATPPAQLSPAEQYKDFAADKTPLPNDAERLEKWMDGHIAAGYTEEQCSLALRVGCMDSIRAEFVLRTIKGGKPLPENVPGIWSEAEDIVLRGGDAREIKRLEEKHGKDMLDERVDFLKEWDASGERVKGQEAERKAQEAERRAAELGKDDEEDDQDEHGEHEEHTPDEDEDYSQDDDDEDDDDEDEDEDDG